MGIGVVAGLALAGSAQAGWSPAPLDAHGLKLFDGGVADVEADGSLDVYTVNHSYRGSMLVNDGSAGFDDHLYDLGLGQDAQFPGLESQGDAPLSATGVYIELDGTLLRVRAHGIDHPRRLRVRFRAPADLVSDRERAEVRLRRAGSGTVARLKLRDGADIRLSPRLLALPIEVRLRTGLDPSETFVGSQAVPAPGDRFTLTLRDRHAIAWADFNGDDALDAFVARGGLKGRIARYRELVDDELLIGDGSAFDNAYPGSGLVKGNCRGRSAAAVDFDVDGRLDIFEGCEDTPPRLYRRRADGTYANVSAGLRDAGASPGATRWADLDADGDPELVSAGKGVLEVFSRRGGGWARTQRLRIRNDGPVANLAMSDFDRDGDPDLFAAARTENTLLIGAGGELRARDPRARGLPGAGLWASWTDHDNDGLADLDVQPRGLHEQAANGEFDPAAGPTVGGRTVRAVGAWPDANSDGARDSLLFWQPRSVQAWRSTLELQTSPGGHWLQIDPGAAGAGEIGARVEVGTSAGTQTGWIGESETSLRSQGHYRVYFGLGAATEADVEIVWPDGFEQDLGTVAADQVVGISR